LNQNLKKQFLGQIEELKQLYTILKGKSKYEDFSDLEIEEITSLKTRIIATIKRITGTNSSYYREIQEIKELKKPIDSKKLKYFIGPLDALYSDLQSDYLKSLSELISGDIFSDYLDMAEHLFNESYKDAAAVIAGSTLEEHLRKLCQNFSIDITIKTKKGIKPKKADQMNSDLVKQNVYSTSEQKQITAWLAIRNDAAHGNYSNYTSDQVKLLIQGVRDFFIRNPA